MTKEDYIDHEVRLRMTELCYEKLNKKLDLIFCMCLGIFSVVLIPVLLHGMKLI